MGREIIFGLGIVICFASSYFLNRSIQFPKIEITKQEAAFNFKPKVMKIASFGLSRMLADLLWVKTLLDSDLEHYEKKDLNSWMYLRFLSIATLDPKFYENYFYGGQYLMIVKDDILGAEEIFKRGLSVYPEDMSLNWQAGYLNAIEKGDLATSLLYFDKIRSRPDRPPMFDSLYTKIASNTLGAEEALMLTLPTWKSLPDDEPIKKRLEKQIYSLRAIIDLKCLNQNLDNCSTKDLYGRSYIKKSGGEWIAPEEILDLKWKFHR